MKVCFAFLEMGREQKYIEKQKNGKENKWIEGIWIVTFFPAGIKNHSQMCNISNAKIVLLASKSQEKWCVFKGYL